MNILVINGSPRTMGNTSKLINAFLSGFSRDDKVKIYNAFDLSATPCNACGYCKAANGCSKKDLEEFFGYYNEADVVVVATPVYNLSLPAPMKALFDRFQRFYEAKNRRGEERVFDKDKKAVIIVTAGSDGRIGFEVIKKQVESLLSNMDTKITASMLAGETDTKSISDYNLARARELIKYI